MDGNMPDDERLPDLGDEKLRLRRGCQIDFHGGLPRRMCVEDYEDVRRKKEEAGPLDCIELRVVSDNPFGESVVRVTIEAQMINLVLEVTDELEDQWKRWEEEQEKLRAEGGGAAPQSVFIPGIGQVQVQDISGFGGGLFGPGGPGR